jgi:hypothetical protein
MKRSTTAVPDERWDGGEGSMLEFVRKLGQRLATRARRDDARLALRRFIVIASGPRAGDNEPT